VSAPDSRLSLRPGKRKRLRSEKREAPELASVPGGDSSPISLPSQRARPVREPGKRRVCLAADQDGKSSSDQALFAVGLPVQPTEFLDPFALLYRNEQLRYAARLKRKREDDRDEEEHRQYLRDIANLSSRHAHSLLWNPAHALRS